MFIFGCFHFYCAELKEMRQICQNLYEVVTVIPEMWVVESGKT